MMCTLIETVKRNSLSMCTLLVVGLLPALTVDVFGASSGSTISQEQRRGRTQKEIKALVEPVRNEVVNPKKLESFTSKVPSYPH